MGCAVLDELDGLGWAGLSSGLGYGLGQAGLEWLGLDWAGLRWL